MTLSKRQKMSLGLFGIALVALVIDRAFLSGGGPPAGASASPSPAPVTQTPPESVLPEEDIQPSTIRLSQRLETLWLEKERELNQARDVFTLSESWLTEILAKKPEDILTTKKDAVTVFLTNHQLQAVVISNQTRCVTVNNHLLELEEELDGFKLVAIEEDSAIFESGTKRAVLKLKNDR